MSDFMWCEFCEKPVYHSHVLKDCRIKHGYQATCKICDGWIQANGEHLYPCKPKPDTPPSSEGPREYFVHWKDIFYTAEEVIEKRGSQYFRSVPKAEYDKLSQELAEAKEARIIKAIKSLDGFAVCNIDEPSDGDLERIYNAYSETWDVCTAQKERIAELEAALNFYTDNDCHCEEKSNYTCPAHEALNPSAKGE